MKPVNMHIRLSAATREHLEALGRRYGSMTAALEIAVDRMWRAEMDTVRVLKARQIKTYQAPGYLIEVVSESADDEENATAIMDYECQVEVLDRNIRGWDEFNAVIRVTSDYDHTDDYLAVIR